jgi:predicted transcriptional regulator
MSKTVEDWDSYPVEPSIGGPLFGDEPPCAAGPFDNSTHVPDREEILVAGLIWKHQGRERSLAIARIAEVTAFSPRSIKTIVERLRKKHHCQIGPRHEDPAGYFWIVDEEDRRLARAPFHSQITSMFDTLLVLDSREGCRGLIEKLRSKL